MEPHFIDDASLSLVRVATEALTHQQALEIYDRFLRAREAAMIQEIRRACGIGAVATGAEETGPDDFAADIQADDATPEDEAGELEAETQFA